MNRFVEIFPALKKITYLNTPANGLLPKPVMEWRRKMDEEFLSDPFEHLMNMHEIIHDTKTTLARYFDSKEEEVALIPNFSFGINSVLEGLPKGQKILLLKQDYPSVNWPVESRDFKVHYAEVDENLEQNVESAVEQYQPDVFLFSVVQWLSGIKIDLNFLRSLKQKHPKLLIVADGTQYLGMEKFSFKDNAIDVLGASCYKWMTSGFGNGFLMIKKNVWDRFSIKIIGFNSSEDFANKPDSRLFMKDFEPGHQDALVYGSIAQSIKMFESLDPQSCFAHLSDLAAKAKNALNEKGFLRQDTALRKQHSSFFNLIGNDALFQRMMDHKIICSQRGGGIRLGFHYYNNENDLDRLIEVLK